jgi:peroxiredoxin
MSTLLTVGQRLPDLRVLTATSRPTSIEAHLGSRVTFLNFLHGTWCADCVCQLYRLGRHRREIAAAGADIVVITRDKPESLATFLLSANPSLEYTVLVDPDGAAHQQVGAGGHTMALVVDGNLTVQWMTHWSDYRDQPGYQTLLQILREAAGNPLTSRA